MTDRDRILTAVTHGLSHSRAALDGIASSASHTPPTHVHPPTTDLVSQLATELERLEVRVHRCTSDSSALDALSTVLTREHARSVLTWHDADLGLTGLEELLMRRGITQHVLGDRSETRSTLDTLATCDVGITAVDLAIAESGTLVVLSGPGRPRVASLLTPVHVALVRQRQIVRGLGDAFAQLRQRDGEDLLRARSNLTFITGPSRTADIELTLTLGVHGPRAVDVLLVADGRTQVVD